MKLVEGARNECQKEAPRCLVCHAENPNVGGCFGNSSTLKAL